MRFDRLFDRLNALLTLVLVIAVAAALYLRQDQLGAIIAPIFLVAAVVVAAVIALVLLVATFRAPPRR